MGERLRALLCALCLLCLAAAAQEGELSPEQAADQVANAWGSQDEAPLERIANGHAPDPWDVAWVLCSRGEFGPAAGLAARAGPALVAEVDRLKALPPARETCDLIREIRRLLDAGDYAAAAALVPAKPPEPSTLTEMKLLKACAAALFQSGDASRAAPLFERLAKAGGRVGWIRLEIESTMALALALSHVDGNRAAEIAERGVDLAQRGRDKVLLAKAKSWVGMVRMRVGDVDGSIRADIEAAEIYEETGDRSKAIECRMMAAGALLLADRPVEALPQYEHVVEVARAAGSGAAELEALEMLARTLWSAKMRQRCTEVCEELLPRLPPERRIAILTLERALAHESEDWDAVLDIASRQEEIARAVGARSALLEAAASRGMALRYLGRVEEATAVAVGALEFLKGAEGAAELVEGYGDLGSLLLSLGRAREALPLLLARLEAIEGAPLLPEGVAPDQDAIDQMRVLRAEQLAPLLNLVCAAQLASGDAEGAQATARRALVIATSPGAKSRAWCSLARAESALGNVGAELSACQSAVDCAEQAGDAAATSSALGLLAIALDKTGDRERSFLVGERVVPIRRTLPSKYGLAQTLHNHALSCRSRDDQERAIALEREALAIFMQLGFPKEEAQVRNGLAICFESSGRMDEARVELEAAVDIAMRAGAVHATAEPLLNLARLARARGEGGAARALAKKALEAASPGSETRILALAQVAGDARRAGELGEALATLREAAEAIGKRYDRLAEEEGARAREEMGSVFRSGLEISREANRCEDALFFLEAGRARSLLLAMGGRDALRRTVIREDLRRLELQALERRRRAEQALGEAVDAGRRAEVHYWRAESDAAERELGEMAARIQREVRAAADLYCPSPVSLEGVRSLLGPDEALLLAGPGKARFVVLVVTSTGAQFVDGPPRPDPRDDEDAQLEAWRRALEGSLRLGPGVRRILVCPPGSQAILPWCRLFPGRELAYLPSATLYSMLRSEKRTRGSRVLALGAPEYRRGTLPPLPGSGEEARAVADLLLLAEGATSEGLRAALPREERWHAIHLACHALIDSDSPLSSRLALTPTGEGGGWLTARDLLGLSMPADLVVLSACETARGKVSDVEGVMGFVRVFLFAGSPRVIGSIWKVDDEATQALMTRFYELWNPRDGSEGIAAATALRCAQEFVAGQERWKDPRYWAAWQLWGLPD